MSDKPLQFCCDIELVAAAASGSRTAFEEIVRRYCRPISQFIAYKTQNVQDAEDLTQETFLKALANIDAFDTTNSLKNWLFVIAYNLVISHYRRRKLQLTDQRELHHIPASPAEFYESADWLWDVVSRMEPDTQTVLWLHYKKDMTVEDITHIMKRSSVAVRVLLHRARKRLEKELRRDARLSEQVEIHFTGTSVMEGTQ
ncbi:MAG: sigma-70 family RNA polymerase sigma factor [Planctomycetes bacterium]|nr:sigma-70 family RNA polymerase sigma factor [Planctomycetota bacterium]